MNPYVLAILGGALVGLAASLLLVFNGQIAGVSGMMGNLNGKKNWTPPWRPAFLLGLLVAGAGIAAYSPASFSTTYASWPVVLLAGLLVGVGTRLANGCTSGHGVCGISRLSTRSIIATCTFTIAGALTIVAMRAFGLLA